MARDARSGCNRRRERGAALVIAVILFALIGVSAVIAVARGTEVEIEKNRRTGEALAQAKAALIGFAAGDVLTVGNRFGDLPCPDLDNDGSAEVSCGDATQRLGRLPWRTLGLPDLRDGDGERLWYAVSDNFKNNPRTSCTAPTDPGCLNSDSRGTLTVRNATGVVAHDGTNVDPKAPGGIAVIIAPGAVLTREGAGAAQDRSAAGLSVAANYLDTGLGQDNASYTEGGAGGFVGGPITSGGNLIVNDRIAVLRYQDLMPVLERRVVREVSACLDQYAAKPANSGRYPWAADSSETALNDRYSDPSGVRAGRVPDGIIGSLLPDKVFTNTRADSGGTMDDTWPGAPCNLGLGYAWWTNWKLHVFYAVADAHKPNTTGTCVDVPCLTVQISATSILLDRRYVVVVSGKPLASVAAGQPRVTVGDRANPQNYLEGENVFTSTPLNSFERQPVSGTFNDVIAYR